MNDLDVDSRGISYLVACILCVWIFIGTASAQSIVCEQLTTDITKLQCYHHQSMGEGFTVVAKTSDGQSLNVLSKTAYPAEGQTTAILYLVDTSNPHRQAVVKKNGELIQNLVAQASAFDKTGIATFDSDFRMLAPIGSEASVLNAAAAQLQAAGSTTEFYRNIISAVQLLEKEAASRKVLVIFSDGLAEDEAYSHEDVIAAAKQANVEIVGIGYAASVLKATALQRLRRLADETSGLYEAAAADLTIAPDFGERFYRHIDRGGQLLIDLSPLVGANEVIIRITPEGGEAVEYRQQVLLAEPDNSKKLYAIAAGFIFLILSVFFIMRRKRLIAERKQKAEEALIVEPEVLAQIEVLDGHGSIIEMTKPIWRIGRSDGNDLQLSDVSISGFHAEIHLNRDGGFSITDLDSTNGVLVNDVEKHSHLLQDGDVIELGDIRIRFHCDGDIIELDDRQPRYYDNEELEETNMYRSDS